MIVLAVLPLLTRPVPPLDPLRVVHPYAAVGRYAGGDRGVDLAGVPGQAVRSATDGTVLFAGAVAGQPVVSVALGDGRRLTYEPVTPAVRTGRALVAGAVLGRLAGTHPGCPAPACLHWGLRAADGSYADPLALLGPPRVRLLPLTGPPSAAPSVGVDLPAGSAVPPVDTAGVTGDRRSGPASHDLPGAAGLGAGAAGVTVATGLLANRRRRRGAPTPST